MSDKSFTFRWYHEAVGPARPVQAIIQEPTDASAAVASSDYPNDRVDLHKHFDHVVLVTDRPSHPAGARVRASRTGSASSHQWDVV